MQLNAVGPDGKTRWQVFIGGPGGSPVVAKDGSIWVGSMDGTLHVVSAAGVERSTLPGVAGTGWRPSAPAAP